MLRTKTDSLCVLESAGWPAFLVDAGGIIRNANQAAVALFGNKLESDSTMLAALWGDESETAEQFLARWERSPTPTVLLKLQGKGAVVTRFLAWIAAFHWEEEKRFVFQFFPEIAGTADNKAPIVEANVAHKQKLDCALQLARTVALDFNNALASILGHTSLLLSKMESSHAWRASLIEVEKAAERAAEVAHQLAAFSRTEKETPGGAVSNLNAVLRRVVELFQRSASPEITWSFDLDSGIYSARFDEAKVQQAVMKILENAIEAVGPRGQVLINSRKLDVTVLTYDGHVRLEPGSYVCAEITDTGQGIPAEVLPRVFEPFFTTKEGHRGLGLAWVYGIITNHGGGVTVASQPKQGASVRIYLPALKKLARGEGAARASDLRGEETILVVDDEDLVLNMSQTILSAFGYTVLTATNGAMALELLAKNNPPVDLVITDLVMPQMSGRELVEKIRLRSPELPIICTSGFMRAPGKKEEDTTFLYKPFTSQELLRRVKQLLTVSEAA